MQNCSTKRQTPKLQLSSSSLQVRLVRARGGLIVRSSVKIEGTWRILLLCLVRQSGDLCSKLKLNFQFTGNYIRLSNYWLWLCSADSRPPNSNASSLLRPSYEARFGLYTIIPYPKALSNRKRHDIGARRIPWALGVDLQSLTPDFKPHTRLLTRWPNGPKIS